jgi:hypothetical protein
MVTPFFKKEKKLWLGTGACSPNTGEVEAERIMSSRPFWAA